MPVRLQCQTRGFYDDYYTIQVLDDNHNGAVTEFKTNLRDSSFKFSGSPKDRLRIINTTEFSFVMLIENQNHMDFWEAMAEEQEGRFFVKVYADIDGVYSLQFVGHLIMDETYLNNVGVSQFIELRSSEGLFRLSDQQYKSDSADQTNAYGNNIEYYEGYDTYLNIIYKCLLGLGTQAKYSSSDVFLMINHNWYESNHPSLSGVSVLEWIRVNQRLFTKKNEEEEYSTLSRAEVLEQILKSQNCKIRYVNGFYLIDNINEIGDDGRTYRKYDKDGNHLGNATVSNTYTVDGSNAKHNVFAGGKFGRLAPYKDVCVQVDYEIGNYGYTPNYWSNDESTLISLGEVKILSENTALSLKGYITSVITTIVSNSIMENSILWFGITLKVGSYYYVTTVTELIFNIEDDNGIVIDTVKEYEYDNEWSLTAGTYLIIADEDTLNKMSVGQFRFSGFSLTTPPLVNIPDDVTPAYVIDDVVEIFVKFEYLYILEKLDQGTDYSSYVDVVWTTRDFFLQPFEGDEPTSESNVAIKYCIENNANNSTSVETNLIIGDTAFNTNNRVEVWDGSDWVGSGNSWANGSITSGGLKLQNLLAEQILRGQNKTIGRYIGSFRGMPYPYYRLKYDDKVWIPSQVSFNPFFRDYNGEWYEFLYDTTSSFVITTKSVKVESSDSFSTAVSSNPAETKITETAYPISRYGTGSRTIDVTDYPIPDPSVTTVGQINYLVEIYRGGARIWYGTTRNTSSFTIDYDANEIILGRALDVGELLRGNIKKIT